MKNYLLVVSFFLISIASNQKLIAQGFFIKPSISYGFALSKSEIHARGARTNADAYSYESRHVVYNGTIQEDYSRKQSVTVPFGKGKTLDLQLGYESKNWLYYSIAFSYFLSDKFEIPSSNYRFSDVQIENHYLTEIGRSIKSVVSTSWYGIQPSIGVFKNIGKSYKAFGSISGFAGLCKISMVEEVKFFYKETKNDVLIHDITQSYASDYRELKGSFIYGFGTQFGIEKKYGKRACLGLSLNYDAKSYKPTKIVFPYLSYLGNSLGSKIAITKREPYLSEKIEEGKRYLFQSLSFGVYWKWYLSVK